MSYLVFLAVVCGAGWLLFRLIRSDVVRARRHSKHQKRGGR